MYAEDVSPGWADLSAVPEAEHSWAHNGIVVTGAGELIGFHAGQLVAFDQSGHVSRSIRPGLTEGHGITLVREGREEFLWISDPGFVFEVGHDVGDEQWEAVFGKGVHVTSRPPRVVKVTLGGEILMELPVPPRDSDPSPGIMGDYCPCGTAVDEERFGGSGDIWVADGYGCSQVHRFDKTGNHRLTLTGEEGHKRFLCPHAVFIDRRGGKTPELYIADRENRCIQVYDMEGGYLRAFGETFLNSPSAFAVLGDLLVIAELYSRLSVVDADDNFAGYVGATKTAEAGVGWPERPGWPNALSDDARAVRAHLQSANGFNSPHSLASDANGNLFVSEWLIGGRYTKLKIHE